MLQPQLNSITSARSDTDTPKSEFFYEIRYNKMKKYVEFALEMRVRVWVPNLKYVHAI